MNKCEIARKDGKKAIMDGHINDRIFASWQSKNTDLASYRNFDDGIVPEMTAKDKELKDYCESHDRVVHAQKYGY